MADYWTKDRQMWFESSESESRLEAYETFVIVPSIYSPSSESGNNVPSIERAHAASRN